MTRRSPLFCSAQGALSIARRTLWQRRTCAVLVDFSGLFLVLCTLYGVMGLLPAVSGVAIVLVLVIHRRENQLAQKPSSAMH